MSRKAYQLLFGMALGLFVSWLLFVKLDLAFINNKPSSIFIGINVFLIVFQLYQILFVFPNKEPRLTLWDRLHITKPKSTRSKAEVIFSFLIGATFLFGAIIALTRSLLYGL